MFDLRGRLQLTSGKLVYNIKISVVLWHIFCSIIFDKLKNLKTQIFQRTKILELLKLMGDGNHSSSGQ